MLISFRDIEQNLELWHKSCVMRGVDDRVDELRALDGKCNAIKSELDRLRAQRNTIDHTHPAFRSLSEKIKELAGPCGVIELEIQQLVEQLPNFVHIDTPSGLSEKDNVVLEVNNQGLAAVISKEWGAQSAKAKESAVFDANGTCNLSKQRPQESGAQANACNLLRHEDLPERLYAKRAAAEICGARTSIFRGDLALLKFVLGQWLVDLHGNAGFEYVDVPSIVSERAMYNAGKLPKFAFDAFSLNEKSWLASTGEIPLVCLMQQKCDRPVRLMTYSECFRKEAGAAGRDTRGWVRQHQFSKVELVIATPRAQTEECFDLMCDRVVDVLNRLGLIWRKVAICAGDMGFGAYKQVDFEVWLVGQRRWLEVSSVSDCRTYQSARLNIKDQNKDLVSTLNGTGGVPGRLLAAVVEQYYDNGIVRVPDCLQEMMGKKEIRVD